jgi:hypothetical protein
MHVALRYCAYGLFYVIYNVFTNLCNFVTYCFDFIAYCISALFMTNSTFKPTFAEDAFVTNSTFKPTFAENAFVNVCIYAQQERIRMITAFATSEMCIAKSRFICITRSKIAS